MPVVLQVIKTAEESYKQYCGFVKLLCPDIPAVNDWQVLFVISTLSSTDNKGGVTLKHLVMVVSVQLS